MSEGYGAYLRRLLQPLGVYRLDGESLSGCELDVLGAALDEVERALDQAEREGCIATAEQTGLTEWAKLFTHPPAAEGTELLREAIAALLRIGEDSFTIESINETISGCGVSCFVEETETPNVVRVSFPETAGVPANFARKRTIIEEIIPCHLAIDYAFQFMTWLRCESKAMSWRTLEEAGHSWQSFENAI